MNEWITVEGIWGEFPIIDEELHDKIWSAIGFSYRSMLWEYVLKLLGVKEYQLRKKDIVVLSTACLFLGRPVTQFIF